MDIELQKVRGGMEITARCNYLGSMEVLPIYSSCIAEAEQSLQLHLNISIYF